MSGPLAEITSLRLGGPPGRMIEARTEAEAIEAVAAHGPAGRGGPGGPLLILGGASNVVVADEGVEGTVLRMRNRGVEIRRERGSAELTVAAGEVWDELVSDCVDLGLTGFECLSGIPGSVGATPIQNVGAYGQEVAETIVSVRAYDREAGEVVEMAPEECGFGYRTSVFKRSPDRWLVLSVGFRLDDAGGGSRPIRYAQLAGALGVEAGQRASLEQVRRAVLGLRRGKGLLADPDDPEGATAGSFFTNPELEPAQAEALRDRVRERLGEGVSPPLYPQPDGTVKSSAAWLIERAGFEPGYGDPEGIAISSRHALVLTNRGRGSTRELLALAHEIADGVLGRFGVELRPEPMLVGVSWSRR